jgi:hypothetical protein
LLLGIGTSSGLVFVSSDHDFQVTAGTDLEFSDKTVFIENNDGADLARLYVAALGCAPDAKGLAAWEAAYNALPAAAKAAGVYQSLAQTNDSAGMSIQPASCSQPSFKQNTDR